MKLETAIALAIVLAIIIALAIWIISGYDVVLKDEHGNSSLFILPTAHAQNITLDMNKGEFWFCYIEKKLPRCSFIEVDNSEHRLMGNFLEFMNSGMVKERN